MDTRFFDMILPLVADAVEHTNMKWEPGITTRPHTVTFTASTNGRTGKMVVDYFLIITDYSPSATMTVHMVREVHLPERTAEEHKAWAYSKVRPVQAKVITSSAMDWEPTKDGTPLETVIKSLMVSVQEDAGTLMFKADGVHNV